MSLVLIPVAAVLVAGGLTPVPALLAQNGDIRVYEQAGANLIAGRLPYVGFPSEYPPLALAMFVVPFLVRGAHLTLQTYAWIYLAESATLAGAAGLVVAYAASRWRAPSEPIDGPLTAWALLGVPLAPLIAWRFDILPAFLSLAAIVLLPARRPTAAGVALGLSVAAKLYALPLFVVLAIVALHYSGRSGLARFLAGGALVIGVTMLPILIAGGPAAFTFISYQSDRGLQLESVPAGIIELALALVGRHPQVTVGFGAWQLTSPWSQPVVRVLPIIMALVVGTVTAAATLHVFVSGRRAALTLEQIAGACIAVILAMMLSDKVLSPQYLIWILPLAPFLRPGLRWVAIGAAALTVALYPVFYMALRDQHKSGILLLNARNGLLVVLLVLALVTQWPNLRVAAAGLQRRLARRLRPSPRGRGELGDIDARSPSPGGR